MKKSINKIDKNTSELFVVGVGASAGGLDALSRFLSTFNGLTSEYCVVIVMHLSPNHKSELTSILTKRSKWPVKTIKKNEKMESRVVYVTPHNSDIHIEGDYLKLDSLNEEYHYSPSVDRFFKSLAESKGNKAIGVILSGFGKDGAKCIAEIKRNNGFTIAQLPESAKHNSMPTAAINTENIDAILPAEQMFDEINRYCKNSQYIASSGPQKKSMDAIFELLEKRSGTDFSLYKPSTIMRRINRRIDYLQLNSLEEYYEFIKDSPRELDLLFDTVLIGVTEFFRDQLAFDSFKGQLQLILDDKKPGESIRLWSVGCATGEEPYSILILLKEMLGNDFGRYQVQIFATDIDERALHFARKGVYPNESLENISKDLKEKYFTKKDNEHYEINKELKQYVLFTKHDITNNPPFVKLDVLSCRNLLIYFNNDLQKQVFQIFHYALRPKGLLFLGKSESIGVATDLFEMIDKNKMFRKSESNLAYQLKFSRFGSNESTIDERKRNEIRNMTIVDVAKETLYHNCENPFVIITPNAEIKEVHGSLRLYMEVSQGTMNANLFKMANKELVTDLKALLAQVRKTGVQHTSHTVKFSLYATIHYVRIRIAPLIYTISDMQYFMVTFEKVILDDHRLDIQTKLETIDFTDLRVKELEEELMSTKEHLQIFTEELESINEELQTINEELQSSNEELKSTNEELETSNEELQSANEELNTANNELRLSNEALLEKEHELEIEKALSIKNEKIFRSIAENIPNGTVGILNSNFEIQYLAGKGLEKYDLKKEDLLGKNLIELNPSKKEQQRLKKVFSETLKGKYGMIEFVFRENYYSLRTVPLNIKGDSELKIMYLSQEITDQKKRAIKLDMAIDSANLLIYEWDVKNDIFEDNAELNRYLGLDEDTILTGQMYMDKIHKDDHEHIEEQWKNAQKTGFLSYEARLLHRNEEKWIRAMGRIIFDTENKPDRVIVSIIDITKDKIVLENLKTKEQQFREIANTVPAIIWMTDENNNRLYQNDNWYQFTGGTSEKHLGKGWLDVIHPKDKETVRKKFLKAYEEKKSFNIEYRIRRYDGEYCWFLVHARPLFEDDNTFKGFIGSKIDITAQRKWSDKLEEMVEQRTKELHQSNEELIKVNLNLEEYAYVASHDLQEPIRKIRTFNSIIDEIAKDEEVLTCSKKIEKSAARMSELVMNILDYSKLSEASIDMETLELDKIISFIEEDLELLIEEKNANIKYNKLGTIEGIDLQITQLFGNIIKNSLKFSSEAPPFIQLYSESINGKDVIDKFDADKNKDYLKITVEDNGIGIKKKFVEQVFKPFKRLNPKHKYSGTGIGLAISKKIVEMHKGYIEIDKSYKGGTAFVIYLPKK